MRAGGGDDSPVAPKSLSPLDISNHADTTSHSIIKKHEGKLIGAFMISTWGASAALVVKTALEADYSVLAKKSGPTKTTTSPGPTIQGFDVSAITIINNMLISLPLKDSNTDCFAVAAGDHHRAR